MCFQKETALQGELYETTPPFPWLPPPYCLVETEAHTPGVTFLSRGLGIHFTIPTHPAGFPLSVHTPAQLGLCLLWQPCVCPAVSQEPVPVALSLQPPHPPGLPLDDGILQGLPVQAQSRLYSFILQALQSHGSDPTSSVQLILESEAHFPPQCGRSVIHGA